MIITDVDLLQHVIETIQSEVDDRDIRSRIYLAFFKIFTPMEDLLGIDIAYDDAYSEECEF